MAMDLESISDEASYKAPRIVILGKEKLGKTCFACGDRVEDGKVVEYGLNKPIVISVKGEEGADAIPVPKFPVANSFDDVMDALGALYKADKRFETVVIDSASTLEPLIWEKTCMENDAVSIEKVGGGYGKGYTEALEHWARLTAALDALRDKHGMASVIIGHTIVKSINDPDVDAYDAYKFAINDKAANQVMRWADVVLFANTKKVVKKEEGGFKEKARAVDASKGQRYLYTQARPSHPGGGRGIYGSLPYELPLSWSSFTEAVAAAMNNETTK